LVTISDNGTISVVDSSQSGGSTTSGQTALESDQIAKCNQVSDWIKNKYWYYLRDAQTIFSSHTPTTKRYFCLNIYANVVGTFLFIGNWELATGNIGVNNLVRLGDGNIPDGNVTLSMSNYNGVTLKPQVLEMQGF
jgi:hypothetical protein